MKRTSAAAMFILSLAVLAWGQTASQVPLSAGQQPSLQPASTGPKYSPDALLVRFRAGASSKSIQSAHAAVRAQVVRNYHVVPGLQRVQLPSGMSVGRALQIYRRNPAVQYAEPDFVVQIVGTPVAPNDPLFASKQWDMNNTGQTGGTVGADIHAEQAWSITPGSSSVVLGVIDTGFNYNHPDLTDNVWSAPFPFVFNGVPCALGSHGFNAITNTCDPMDDNGHGTHVSGTIGARGNNNIGVAGVNWFVSIVACKFLSSGGFGSTSDAVTCLEFFKDLKDSHGINVVATNNSWGGGGFSQALSDAIDANRQSGILFMAAAGNGASNNDGGGFFPADYYLPNVIAVASTDLNDNLSGFSDYGKRTVHLGAPGSAIFSTMLTSGPLSDPTGYGLLSGTSMATPHVTGMAGLLKAQDPSRDWRAIKNLILAGGDNKPSLTNTITGKRLNANGSLTCSNSTVLARLLPTGDTVSVAAGSTAQLAVLNINCAAPAGDVTLTINPGGTVVLKDDGAAPDQVAGDGIYSAQFIFSTPGQYTVSIAGGETFTVNALAPYFYQPVAFNYRTIAGTSLNFFDDSVTQITPSFPIPFAGGSFSTLWVSSNGLVSFDTPFSNYFNTPLPATGPGTVVAPFWDDLLSPTPSQNVFWAVTGAPPNRELVVEWRDVIQFESFASGCPHSESVRFQVVFFESKSDILFNYMDPVFGGCASFADFGASSTIGVQVGPAAANQFSFSQPSLDNNTALLWTTTGPNVTNPLPALASLSPTALGSGGPDFTLTLNGSNFVDGSSVRWNGSDRPTTFLNSGQLTAQISAADIAVAGTATVTVFNFTGGASNALLFTIPQSDFGFTDASLAPAQARLNDPASSGSVTLAPVNGFNSAVTLDCTVVPAGPACSAFTPAAPTPPGGATFTVSVGAGAGQNYSVIVTGTGGGRTHSVALPYSIWDYSVLASANFFAVPGSTTHLGFTLHPQGGSQQNVDVSCTNLTNIAGATCSIVEATPVALAGGDVALTVALTVPGGTTSCSGPCSFTIHTQDHDVPALPAHDAVVNITRFLPVPPTTASDDFDADGHADILWQNSSTGDVVVWLMNGATKTSAAFVATGVDPNWKSVGVGDFDGDGKADVLWQNSATGGVVVWLMNGASKTGAAFVATGVDAAWKIVGVGDFDGDGKSDILWRNNSTGGVVVWIMDGASKTSAAFVATAVDPNWQIVGVGDFDGDGRADILWRNSLSGDVVLWLMSGATKLNAAMVANAVSLNLQVVGVGDFYGDGKVDVLWRNSSTGDVVLWRMNGATIASMTTVAAAVDPAWQVFGISDFDGDGKTDLLWRNSSTGSVVVWTMNGAAKTNAAFVSTNVDPAWKIVPFNH